MALIKINIRLFFISCLLLSIPTLLHAEQIVDGTYVGWKQLSDLSPYDKSEKWYHEHILKINRNSILIEASTTSVKNGKIQYSSSTGGFYVYKGTIFNKNNKTYVKLQIQSCDYCPQPAEGKFQENEYEIYFRDELTFIINDVLYVFQKPEN
jgi:hypothetical protein